MTTTSVGSSTVAGLYTGTTSAKVSDQKMDKEMFLTLLVAQLRYQDPTSPMDTSEMMAQTNQLAMTEQLTEVADTGRESFALQMRVAASALIGKEVSFVDEDGVTQTGTVTAASFEDAVPTVTVGERTVPLDSVSAIRAIAATTSTDSPGSTGSTGSTA